LVAVAPHGFDEARLLWVITEFFAQGGDVHVDSTVKDIPFAVGDLLNGLLAGFDTAKRFGE